MPRIRWAFLFLTTLLALVLLRTLLVEYAHGQAKVNPALTRWPPPGPPLPKGLPWKTPGKDTRIYTPADVSRLAAQDAVELAKTVIADEMYQVRYLSIANVPLEFRDWYVQSISLLINSLSRERDITIPAVIGGDEKLLVRINLNDYGILAKDWDNQGKIDPYFQQQLLETPLTVREKTVETVKPGAAIKRTVEKKVPYEDYYRDDQGHYYKNADGSWKMVTKYKTVTVEESVTPVVPPTVSKESVQEQKAGKTKQIQTPGAVWLDGPSVKTLVGLLQSQTPILRGDWWLANASLPPVYYDLLRLKTLDDAKELAAFDKRVQKVTAAKATVVFSGSDGIVQRVARNNRILFRINTAYGAWWETFDFKASVKDKNVIHNFLTDKRDGGEIIFNLPNGLQGYFLVNNKDERVDEVPIDIAVDYRAQDARVRNGRSCIWCHQQGMQPFKSDFKLTITPQGLIDLGIKATDAENVLDLKGAIQLSRDIRKVFQTPDFSLIVKGDNLRYNNSVKAATGQTAATMANRFLALYDDYQEAPMNHVRLIYEAGKPDLDVKAAIKIKLEGVNNGVLLRQLLTPPLKIRRDHFEEAYDVFARSLVAMDSLPRKPHKPDKMER